MSRRGVSAWFLLLLAPGCSVPEPPPVEPPPPISRAPQDDVLPDGGPRDHWIEAYGAYFDREERRDYLATPVEARLDRFGLRLLDLRLRQDLYEANRDLFSQDDLERYRSLESAALAHAFVSELRRRRGGAREPPPRDRPGSEGVR